MVKDFMFDDYELPINYPKSEINLSGIQKF